MTSTATKNDIKTAHVLMVDDDSDDLFLTKASFQKAKHPFKFTGVNSAAALFDILEQDGIANIDIILLDLNMPDMDGLEALKTLLQRPNIEAVKIFMFSSSSSHKDRDKCVEAGAEGYLYKPSGADEVKRFVNTISLASNFWI